MANQIEAPKVVQYVLTGANADEIAASKVVMYLVLEPGEIVDGSTRQSHVSVQILRRS